MLGAEACGRRREEGPAGTRRGLGLWMPLPKIPAMSPVSPRCYKHVSFLSRGLKKLGRCRRWERKGGACREGPVSRVSRGRRGLSLAAFFHLLTSCGCPLLLLASCSPSGLSLVCPPSSKKDDPGHPRVRTRARGPAVLQERGCVSAVPDSGPAPQPLAPPLSLPPLAPLLCLPPLLPPLPAHSLDMGWSPTLFPVAPGGGGFPGAGLWGLEVVGSGTFLSALPWPRPAVTPVTSAPTRSV